MLKETIQTLIEKINTYIDRRKESTIFVNSFNNLEEKTHNKILISLIEIRRESDIDGGYSYIEQEDDYMQRNHPFLFNIDLLFVLNFENSKIYEGLFLLEKSIAFFHANRTMQVQAEEFFELSISLDYKKSSEIWNKIKIIQPFFVCTISHIAISDNRESERIKRIEKVEIEKDLF